MLWEVNLGQYYFVTLLKRANASNSLVFSRYSSFWRTNLFLGLLSITVKSLINWPLRVPSCNLLMFCLLFLDVKDILVTLWFYSSAKLLLIKPCHVLQLHRSDLLTCELLVQCWYGCLRTTLLNMVVRISTIMTLWSIY